MITQGSSIKTYHFSQLTPDDSISHFVSTRMGGVSPSPYSSLNIGFHVEDSPSLVKGNRERLALSVGIPLRYFTFAKQVHGVTVAVVTDEHRGRGASEYDSALDDTDALVTDQPDLCVAILVADCVPVLFYDPRKRVVAAAHAGWKGTAGLIGQRVILVMQERFGSDPSDILVGIGPSIGPCCYQVGSEVISEFKRSFARGEVIGNRTEDGRGYLDLWEANRVQLLDIGVPDKNIEVARICTHCHSDEFFSHRKEGKTGRFAAGIMLRNEQCVDCTNIVCNWCCRP